MMYSNGLAFAVKVGGKVLREFGDKVYVPFGSEYSLLIKNQKQERALVNITIDGRAVTDGGFIIDGKGTLDIERFVKDLDKGNKFKFIERTKKIEDGKRGAKVDDGLIVVDFQYEQPATVDIHHYERHHYHHDHDYWWHRPYYGGGGGLRSFMSNTIGGAGGGLSQNGAAGEGVNINLGAGGTAVDSTPTSTITCSTGTGAPTNIVRSKSVFDSAVKNDVGITVPGSVSNQKFTTAYIGTLSAAKFSMVIHILGKNEGVEVTQPAVVARHVECETCGEHNKQTSKFCKECGTALHVIA